MSHAGMNWRPKTLVQWLFSIGALGAGAIALGVIYISFHVYRLFK